MKDYIIDGEVVVVVYYYDGREMIDQRIVVLENMQEAISYMLKYHHGEAFCKYGKIGRATSNYVTFPQLTEAITQVTINLTAGDVSFKENMAIRRYLHQQNPKLINWSDEDENLYLELTEPVLP